MSDNAIRLEWQESDENALESGASFACAYRVLGLYRNLSLWRHAILTLAVGVVAIAVSSYLWWSVLAGVLLCCGLYVLWWGYAQVQDIRMPRDAGVEWIGGVRWFAVTDDDHRTAKSNKWEMPLGAHVYRVDRGGDAEWTWVDRSERCTYRASSITRIIRCGDRLILMNEDVPRMSVPLRAFRDEAEVGEFVGMFGCEQADVNKVSVEAGGPGVA